MRDGSRKREIGSGDPHPPCDFGDFCVSRILLVGCFHEFSCGPVRLGMFDQLKHRVAKIAFASHRIQILAGPVPG